MEAGSVLFVRLLRLQLLLHVGTASGASTATERRVEEVIVFGPAEEKDVGFLDMIRAKLRLNQLTGP